MAGNSLYWANTINGSLSLNGVAFMSYGDVPIFFNNSIIGGDVGMKTVGGALYAYNNIIKNTRLGFHAFTKAANLTNNDFRNNTYAIYSTTTDAPNNYINNIFFDNKYGFYGGISNFTGGSMQSRDYDIWMTTNTINISSVNFTTLKLFIDGGMPAGPNNYFQQDNSSDVKIKTKSIGTLSLTRKILNLASSYVSWQDISNYSVAYNISGLKKGAYYNIWNGTNLFANFVLSNNTEDFMFGVANAMTSITTWIIVPSTTLNIECYDELTQQPICFQAYFVNNATSYNSSLSCGSFSFNTTDIPLGYTKVTITNSSYISRGYFVTIPSNPTNNITLRAYLLQSGSGSYITTFTYSNSFPSGIYGALTTIYKFINNSWVVIDQKSTDTQGKGYFYLYPWSEYQVSASYNGYTTLLSSYYPNPSYVLYLKINDVMTTSNASWIFDTVSITYSPQDTYISGLVPISYKITDSNSSLQYYSLYLRSVNSSGYVTNLWNQSTSSSPSGGIITVNLNVSNTTGTRYEVLINFKRVGYDEWNKTYTYFPSNPNYNATIFGSFPTNIIPDTLEAFKNGAFVASDTGKMLVAIFLALAAGGLAAKNSIRMGLPTSIGGTIAFIIVLGIFVAAGALGSMGWGILLLLGLTGIGINLARYIL